MLGMEKFASLNRIYPLTLPSCCRQCVPGCTELCPVLPLQCCLSLACRVCGQRLFLPTHLCSTSSLHVILGVMGGRRRTSPPTLFTVSPCIHACFKCAINKCSGPDSVAVGEFQWFEVLVHLSGSVGCLWWGLWVCLAGDQALGGEQCPHPSHQASAAAVLPPCIHTQPLHCQLLGLLV